MRNFLKLISFTSALLLAGNSPQIYSSEQKKIDLNSNILISNAIEEKEIKTVTANGFGTTIESAAQNAAENALTNVVGSFLDVQVLIKEKTKISDGILKQTSIIKENINDYSQGSIKYFEILNIQEKDSIYIVTARVDVRIEDFRAYIKELAFAEKEISKNLYADAIASETNEINKLKILHSKLLQISRGEVINVDIGSIQLLKNFEKPENLNLRNLSSLNKNTTIVFPVKISLKPGFIENLLNTLENIGANKKSFPNDSRIKGDYLSIEWLGDFRKENSSDCGRPNKILIFDVVKYKSIFCIPMKMEYEEFEFGKGSKNYPLLSEQYIRSNVRRNDNWYSISIKLFDSEKFQLINDVVMNNCKNCENRGFMVNLTPPWHPSHSLLGNNYKGGYSGLYLKEEKFFYYVIPLEMDELKDLSNISVKILNQ